MLTVYCRICLNPSQLNEIVSLFDTHQGFSIRDALLDLFQIKIMPTEMLSAICKKCVAKLCTVRDIREEFIAQDRKYQQMISNSCKEESPPAQQQNASKPAQTDDGPACEKESQSAQQQQTAAKPPQADAEPCPEAESTTEEHHLHKEETSKGNECLELSEVQEKITSDNGDSNSIIYYVEQSNDTDGQDTPQSEYEVMLVPKSPGKSPVRFEISNCTARHDYDSEEVEIIEGKNNDDSASVREFCAYSEDTSEPTVAPSENETTDCTRVYVCEWCEIYFDKYEAYLAHICPEQPKSTEAHENQSKMHRVVGKSSKKALPKEEKRPLVGFGASVICPHCSDVFDKDNQLLRHGKSKHPDQFQIIRCNECTEEFATSDGLYEHEWLLHRTGYQCKFCKKRLPTAFALQSHENVHTRRQTFSCSVCNKMFSQYTSMWRHMLIHSDIKAYECDLCQRRFRQRTVMLAHRLVHTGEKPYRCDKCNKSFRDRSTLARHGQVHAREKMMKKKETTASTAD